jgi:hypothetical protein
MRQGRIRKHGVLAVLLAVALLAGGRSTALAQVDDTEWSAGARWDSYQDDLFGLYALLGLAGTTAWDHLRDDPEEWDDGAEGLGLRAASNAGRLVVGQSTRHGLAALMGHSTRYQRCTCSGFGSRIGHALLETATDRKRSGSRAIAIPRVAGSFAGAYAQMLWRPELSAEEAAVDAAGGLLYGAAVNVARELIGW